MTYDLTGLPPSLGRGRGVRVRCRRPDAYEELVDRLLASPRYGEKWGRHWLDLVRYAETNSYERDGTKPNAWRYRDYVIRAMNVRTSPTIGSSASSSPGMNSPTAVHDGLIATGYYRLGLWDDEPADRDQSRYDGLDDIVATTSQVFLGLTVDCARCHDHKLDPIPQKDYYRFLSFFQNVNDYRNGGPTDEAVLFKSDRGDRRAYEAAQRLARPEVATRSRPSFPPSRRSFASRYRRDSEGGARSRRSTSTTWAIASTATPSRKPSPTSTPSSPRIPASSPAASSTSRRGRGTSPSGSSSKGP